MARPRPPSRDDPWALRSAGFIVLVGGFLTMVVGSVAFLWAPRWTWLVGDFSSQDALQQAQSSIRETGLRVAAGIGVATAGILAWGRLELSRREHHLERIGQITDRYTRAVEQLGGKDPSVRLGALYALERLATDSVDDRQTIYDVICAYCRSHSPRVKDWTIPPLDGDFPVAVSIALRAPSQWNVVRNLRGALISDHDVSGQMITQIRLDDAVISNVNFSRSTVAQCTFVRSRIWDLDLSGALISGVDFGNAVLRGPPLLDEEEASSRTSMARLPSATNIDLVESRLVDVSFDGAVIEDVSFEATHRTRVSFRDAGLIETPGIERQFL